MKKFNILVSVLAMCIISGTTHAKTINWYVDSSVYDTSTCSSGGDLILPTTPTKRGYTFMGWRPYIPIEYIQTSGTQYIDTGYTSNSNGYSYIETQFTPTQVGAQQVVFGATTGANKYQPTLVLDSNFFMMNGSNNKISVGNFVANTKYTMTFSTNGNLTVVQNGIAYTGGVAGIPAWSAPIYLFRYNGVATGSAAQYSKVKMHYFRLYDNGTLVRDLIPVKDGNNVPCMFDKVSGQFFYNAGTGSFTAGPEL